MGLIIACCASWQQWHVSLFSYKLQQFASLCVDIIQTCRQQFQLRNLCSILYYRCKDVVMFMLQYNRHLKLKHKKLVEAHLLKVEEEPSGEEALLMMSTLIHSNLHKDSTGSAEEFAEDYAQALWLEQWRRKNLVQAVNEAIVKSFDKKD